MDFDKIGGQWSRVSFSFDQETPQDLRVEMFVRKAASAPEGKELYDIGWADEFGLDGTCSFKSMQRVGHETGIDFTVIGLKGDLSEVYALSNVPKRDVVWLHTISRFWAIKNGLVDKLSSQQGGAEANVAIEEKMKRLEQMTFKVLEQNKTIFKTIKKKS